MKKKVMLVFGTRPEAIKMCPLVNELKSQAEIETIVCVTGQHREMLRQVLHAFQVVPDIDLDIMRESQTLFDITISVLEKMKKVLEEVKPDLVLVHGDTSTTFSTALACYYMNIPVGHVEAGLRTYNIFSPYPEEFNRQSVGIIASLHFAPTYSARDHLIQEGKKAEEIFVTGNTVIDALKTTVKKEYSHPAFQWITENSRVILLTAHRRENLGHSLEEIFSAVLQIVEEFKDVQVIYPIHLNPSIRETANKILGNHNRIKIMEPLDVIDFHNFMARSYLILTDSGGIQEEASELGKPVLVMRETTERPEGIVAGTLKLVGTKRENIYRECKTLLNNQEKYLAMSKAANPYGDGHASEKITQIIKAYFEKQEQREYAYPLESYSLSGNLQIKKKSFI